MSRVKISSQTVYARDAPDINLNDLITSLGKISAFRWETLAYIKGGAMMGTNFGRLTEMCMAQINKLTETVASVFGPDPSVLEPGFYSKLFSSSLQRGWRWNATKMNWTTDEDVMDFDKPINQNIVKFTMNELISNMPEERGIIYW